MTATRTPLMWIWALLLAPATLLAQSVVVNYIESAAGNTVFDGRGPLQTPLISPQAVWVNPVNGDLWISDGNFVVRRVRENITTIMAGGGAVVDDALGVAGRSARFDFPSGIVGNATDVYVADVRNDRVRRIGEDGRVTTVVGTGVEGFSGDGGRGSAAQLALPRALALSDSGDLYIADTGNARIRKYNLETRIITTVAGNGQFGVSGDGGDALEARVGSVRGMALDAEGNLYFVQTVTWFDDSVDIRVRRLTPDGKIEHVAGLGPAGYSGDGGPAIEARLGSASGLAIDSHHNIYLADVANDRIRVIDANGVITRYAGKSGIRNPGVEDVPATDASFRGPAGIWVTPSGDLYIADSDNDVIRKISGETRRITTAAGSSNPFDGAGLGSSAPLARPSSVALDAQGNLYIADTGHYRVRRIDTQGNITTVAGDGRGAGNAGATDRSLGSSFTISVDPQGRVLIADRFQGVVRRVNPATGQMTTVLDLTRFDSQPTYAIGDALGNLYVSDYWNDIVWFYDGAAVYRLAGTGDTGDSGDWDEAPKAKLNSPEGLLLDGNGNLLICDTGNHRVRIVDLSTLIISPFAGDGIDNTDFDGYYATWASLERPIALASDSEGNIYIADEDAHLIRYVYASDGTIATLTGGERGFAGDGGPASLARFDRPVGLALRGNSLYVCDRDNYRIRRIYTEEIPIELLVSPRSFTFRGPQGGEDPAAQLMIVDASLLGFKLNYTLGGGTDSGGQWLFAGYLEGSTPDVNYLEARTKDLEPGTYAATVTVSAPPALEVSLPIELHVDPPDHVSSVTLSTDYIALTAPRGGSDSQALQVLSKGAALDWSWTPFNDAPWLRLSALSGATPSIVTLTADASELEPGTYVAAGYFTTSLGGSTLFVVSVTVTDPKPALTLDRGSVVIDSIEGATSQPLQTVDVYNSGSAPMSWRVEIPESAPWLRASRSDGEIEPGGDPQGIGFRADTAGLTEGVYQADVSIVADGAIGSPRSLSVRLRIGAADAAAQARLDRTALVFTGPPATELPLQTIGLSATGALQFDASVRTASNTKWLSVSPATGALLGSSDVYTIEFAARTQGLDPGVHRATVAFRFTDGSVQEVDVQLIVRPAAAVSAGLDRRSRRPEAARPRSTECAPTRQVMSTPTLSNNFSASVGWPVPIRVEVLDDCGERSTGNSVTVGFSTGDPAITLTNLRNGQYTGTWTPSRQTASATLTVRSVHPALDALEVKTAGRIGRTSSPPPVLLAGGVMNAASQRSSGLAAPESMVVLKGVNFPEDAADAIVIAGGHRAHVLSSKEDEIRALIPWEVHAQEKISVLVSARGLTTTAEVLTIVPADPGLFPLAEGAAAVPGETFEITATGLGGVDGENQVISPVTAKLGDHDLAVESAERIEPGVYRLRLKVPDGAAAGKLTVTQGGIVSNAVDIPF